VDYRKQLDQAAMRNSAANLTLSDIAECVADGIKASERRTEKRMVEHVSRVIKLVNLKNDSGHDETRLNSLHRRICALESALHRMTRGREQ
jgi:hypothetical protein